MTGCSKDYGVTKEMDCHGQSIRERIQGERRFSARKTPAEWSVPTSLAGLMDSCIAAMLCTQSALVCNTDEDLRLGLTSHMRFLVEMTSMSLPSDVQWPFLTLYTRQCGYRCTELGYPLPFNTCAANDTWMPFILSLILREIIPTLLPASPRVRPFHPFLPPTPSICQAVLLRFSMTLDSGFLINGTTTSTFVSYTVYFADVPIP